MEKLRSETLEKVWQTIDARFAAAESSNWDSC